MNKLILFCAIALTFWSIVLFSQDAHADDTHYLRLVGIITDSVDGNSALIEDLKSSKQELLSRGDETFNVGVISSIDRSQVSIRTKKGTVITLYISGGHTLTQSEEQTVTQKPNNTGQNLSKSQVTNTSPKSPSLNRSQLVGDNVRASSSSPSTPSPSATDNVSADESKELFNEVSDTMIKETSEDSTIPLSVFEKVLGKEGTAIGSEHLYEPIQGNQEETIGLIVRDKLDTTFLGKIGLEKGDILTGVNGNDVTDFSSLSRSFTDPTQQRLLLYYTRDGVKRSLSVKFTDK
jgi:type II secretory pathway component PulC